MDLTKEQKEIYSKIADIKQVILKNHFDISDLTEQLISTLPFKVDDIVLNQSNEHLLVRKIEPYYHGFGLNKHRYLGKIEVILNILNKDGQPSERNLWALISEENIKDIQLPSKKGEFIRLQDSLVTILQRI